MTIHEMAGAAVASSAAARRLARLGGADHCGQDKASANFNRSTQRVSSHAEPSTSRAAASVGWCDCYAVGIAGLVLHHTSWRQDERAAPCSSWQRSLLTGPTARSVTVALEVRPFAIDVAVEVLDSVFDGADRVIHLAWLIQPSHDE